MRGDSCSQAPALDILQQLELILEHEKFIQRDVATWTAAISGFVAQDCHAQALYIFNAMRSQPEDSNASPNVATMVSVMSACAGLDSLELSKNLHAYVEKARLIASCRKL